MIYDLGYGIVTGTAPRVTTKDPFDAQPTTFENAVLENRLNHVLTAGRRVAARRRCKWRDKHPVEINRDEEDFSHKNLPCLMFDV